MEAMLGDDVVLGLGRGAGGTEAHADAAALLKSGELRHLDAG